MYQSAVEFISRAFEFDDNGFLVAPAPIGNFTPNRLDAYYIGWVGEGHVNRWNVTHAFYQALGRETNNPIAARSTLLSSSPPPSSALWSYS